MRLYKMSRAFHLLASCFGMAKSAPISVNGSSNAPVGVPDFVVKYAPIVYLFSKETYLPSDISAQVVNTTPKLELNPLPAGSQLPSPLTLDNLDQLNAFGTNGTNVYLTSNDDISKIPTWIKGLKPDTNGKTAGTSCAVIVVDKGNGRMDAFYMYFYAFNWGGIVLDKNLGNHVGDWEHTMVRFQNGVPQAVWLSQHSGGEAFKYSVLQKDKSGLRPVVFSGNGSHANYAITGTHDHTLQVINFPTKGIINDYTDAGQLWDPVKSAYWYSWTPPPAAASAVTTATTAAAPSPATSATPAPTAATTTTPAAATVPLRNVSKLGTFTPYDTTTPVGWLYFTGRWGDFQYPKSDPRQDALTIFGQDVSHKYESGPDGPANKQLNRKEVCSKSPCVILDVLVS